MPGSDGRGWLACIFALGLSACGEAAGDDVVACETEAAVDTVADTVSVRATGAGSWKSDRRLVEEVRIGSITGPEETTLGDVRGLAVGPHGAVYVVDQQVPALRKYAPDGSYLTTLGREGGGPGEYSRPDGGVAALPDGRVLLRDPGNARISMYSSEGDYLDMIRIRGGRFVNLPLWADTAGQVYHPVFQFTGGGVSWKLARFDPDAPDAGATGALSVPDWGVDPPMLYARGGGGGGMNQRSVPFTPRESWDFSPLGYVVGGVTDRYAIYLFRPDAPVLRIGRERDPVPVGSEEKENRREIVEARMRRTEPGWSWNGPSIPDTKPYFRRVVAGMDGRIWVRLHVEAERVPEEEVAAADDGPGEVPSQRWREPPVYDVFQPDGCYLGRVRAPDDISPRVHFVAKGDRVWALVTDELDVHYVVRYRIAPAGGS